MTYFWGMLVWSSQVRITVLREFVRQVFTCLYCLKLLLRVQGSPPSKGPDCAKWLAMLAPAAGDHAVCYRVAGMYLLGFKSYLCLVCSVGFPLLPPKCRSCQAAGGIWWEYLQVSFFLFTLVEVDLATVEHQARRHCRGQQVLFCSCFL